MLLTLEVHSPKANFVVCYFKATNLQDKLLINVALCDAGLKVWILQKTQEKLIYELQDQKKREIIKNVCTVVTMVLQLCTQPVKCDHHTPLLKTDLDVRPGGLKSGFVLIGVKILVIAGWEGPKYVGADL